jgi:hypothetical protein
VYKTTTTTKIQHFSLSSQLNGLIIFVTVAEIDGEGATLGKAGPCAFSYSGITHSTFGTVLPRIGLMTFDKSDLQRMLDDGRLGRVVMHEMGHVLGIGTLWDTLRNGSAGVHTNDPRYVLYMSNCFFFAE